MEDNGNNLIDIEDKVGNNSDADSVDEYFTHEITLRQPKRSEYKMQIADHKASTSTVSNKRKSMEPANVAPPITFLRSANIPISSTSSSSSSSSSSCLITDTITAYSIATTGCRDYNQDHQEKSSENSFMREVMGQFRQYIMQNEHAERTKKVEELTFQTQMSGIFTKYSRK